MIRALVLVLTLSGCSSLDLFQSGIAERGAVVSDEARESAEWVLCKGMSVGAWIRAYGQDPDRALAWRIICSVNVAETP